jgi:hypothetical protein
MIKPLTDFFAVLLFSVVVSCQVCHTLKIANGTTIIPTSTVKETLTIFPLPTFTGDALK